jgi:hypothetical protein
VEQTKRAKDKAAEEAREMTMLEKFLHHPMRRLVRSLLPLDLYLKE